MIDSKYNLVLIGILFFIVVSTMANQFQVSGINCADPSSILSQPSENATTVDKVVGPADDLTDVFFGCSSSNPLVNGVFLSLSGAFVVVLLVIVKDLVPFT